MQKFSIKEYEFDEYGKSIISQEKKEKIGQLYIYYIMIKKSMLVKLKMLLIEWNNI